MIHIIICDDEKVFREELKNYLLQYQEEKKISFQIREFCEGETLVNSGLETMDILFLDIKMKPTNGIKIAEKIRAFDELVPIIFITSAAEYALEGYKVNAFDYLVKPISYEKLEKVLTKIINRICKKRDKIIIIKNNDICYKININDIVFVETLNRHCVLHTMYEQYASNKKMKEIEKELCEDNFFRCNSGYIVNFDYIEKILQSEIYLTNKDIITISRPKKKAFIAKLTEYWGKDM